MNCFYFPIYCTTIGRFWWHASTTWQDVSVVMFMLDQSHLLLCACPRTSNRIWPLHLLTFKTSFFYPRGVGTPWSLIFNPVAGTTEHTEQEINCSTQHTIRHLGWKVWMPSTLLAAVCKQLNFHRSNGCLSAFVCVCDCAWCVCVCVCVRARMLVWCVCACVVAMLQLWSLIAYRQSGCTGRYHSSARSPYHWDTTCHWWTSSEACDTSFSYLHKDNLLNIDSKYPSRGCLEHVYLLSSYLSRFVFVLYCF